MSKLEKELNKVNNAVSLYEVAEAQKQIMKGIYTDDIATQVINGAVPNAKCVHLRPIKIKLKESGTVVVYNGSRFVMNG